MLLQKLRSMANAVSSRSWAAIRARGSKIPITTIPTSATTDRHNFYKARRIPESEAVGKWTRIPGAAINWTSEVRRRVLKKAGIGHEPWDAVRTSAASRSIEWATRAVKLCTEREANRVCFHRLLSQGFATQGEILPRCSSVPVDTAPPGIRVGLASLHGPFHVHPGLHT